MTVDPFDNHLVGIICYANSLPADPPSIDLPNFGLLEKAKGSIDRVPDGLDLILKFQDQASVALAPVRRFLEIMELLSSYQKCFSAIPEAIATLSPDPVFNCLKGAAQAFARLVSYIPPMSYVRMGAGIASFCIDMIDELFSLFRRLDNRIAGLIGVYNAGVNALDKALQTSAVCGATATIPALNNTLAALAFIKPANDVLLDPFIRLVPGGGSPLSVIKQAFTVADAFRAYAYAVIQSLANLQYSTPPGAQVPLPPAPPALPAFLDGSVGGGAGHAIIPTPGIGPMVTAMAYQRYFLVSFYNVLALLIGEEEKGGGLGLSSTQFDNVAANGIPLQVPTFQYL